MTRLFAWIRGLFVPRPPPRSLLTDPREFVAYERELLHLQDELDTIKAGRR